MESPFIGPVDLWVIWDTLWRSCDVTIIFTPTNRCKHKSASHGRHMVAQIIALMSVENIIFYSEWKRLPYLQQTIIHIRYSDSYLHNFSHVINIHMIKPVKITKKNYCKDQQPVIYDNPTSLIVLVKKLPLVWNTCTICKVYTGLICSAKTMYGILYISNNRHANEIKCELNPDYSIQLYKPSVCNLVGRHF